MHNSLSAEIRPRGLGLGGYSFLCLRLMLSSSSSLGRFNGFSIDFIPSFAVWGGPFAALLSSAFTTAAPGPIGKGFNNVPGRAGVAIAGVFATEVGLTGSSPANQMTRMHI